MASRLASYVSGNDPKFKVWMAAVDKAVERKVGVSVMDLPDIDFSSLWEDGVKPSAAARLAIKEAGGRP